MIVLIIISTFTSFTPWLKKFLSNEICTLSAFRFCQISLSMEVYMNYFEWILHILSGNSINEGYIEIHDIIFQRIQGSKLMQFFKY